MEDTVGFGNHLDNGVEVFIGTADTEFHFNKGESESAVEFELVFDAALGSHTARHDRFG